MIAYILFDNNFYNEQIVDKTVLEYLLEDLKEIGINKIVGVKYGLDVSAYEIKEYINFNDLDKINEKSLLISSNVFVLDKENFKKNIKKALVKK
jgi:NDP-sugar pyrophosphorylase family protein